jgi:CpeT/CpcT family (DUF1001)
MVERAAASRLSVLCLAVALAAVGCASQAPSHDAQLAQFDEWLPGRYDNQPQIASDRRSGRPPHEPLALAVVPIDALQMGHHVFYIEESVGHIETPGTPRLILAQHLASIDFVSGKIVAALYSFTDPQRWRDGISMPEVFSALQAPDVKLMRGCGLTWTLDPAKLTAANDPKTCLESSPVTLNVEPLSMHVELTRDEIAVSVAPAEAGGGNPAADSYVRFRRSGGP